ncbi:hypothetical protein [Nocardioides speluncae]|uniref:hypothetical protein n=1 Tax=Nocardioides speluncae TaxID=2670337 RepID=UPI000D69190F|nr:hypothetical protein [Nocardioides speluncae]
MASSLDPDARDWEWVCRTVLPRIGMWTGRISFDLTVAFLDGFDAAQPESIRPTMQRRCEERVGRRTPLSWEQYIKAESLGLGVDDLPRDHAMTKADHRAAIAALQTELMDALGFTKPPT